MVLALDQESPHFPVLSMMCSSQKGVRSKYIAESDVLHLDDFAPYVEEVKQNNPCNVKVLLSSCERFIDACDQSDQVYIVDSILPCH